MKTYTKDELISRLKEIRDQGWIESKRYGNHGSIGNTLEDLLGIDENNLPIPNASEWELKTQRSETTSLMTLFHCEPSPTALRFVPRVLLPHYGWEHQQAGTRYSDKELSFRQTISARGRSDRGFGVVVDRSAAKIAISFDAASVDPRHREWLNTVVANAGIGELTPQPYWGFQDLEYKVGSKLTNCFFVKAHVRKEAGREQYYYYSALMLRGLNFEGFLNGLEQGTILVDFDARTGHNHGTKFRIRQNSWPTLYSEQITLF